MDKKTNSGTKVKKASTTKSTASKARKKKTADDLELIIDDEELYKLPLDDDDWDGIVYVGEDDYLY